MRPLNRNLPAVILCVLLLACFAAVLLTRDGGAAGIASAQSLASPIDEGLIRTARRLALLAETPDEQTLAAEAHRLSDHEFDIAFAGALRDAAPPLAPTSGPLKELVARIEQIKIEIAKTQAQVGTLQKQATTEDGATRVELAKAELALEQDELDEKKQDLVRLGGDRRAKLQVILQEHEAAQHGSEPPKAAAPKPTGTLSQQIQEWESLRDRRKQIDDARQQALVKATRLARGHDALDRMLRNQAPPAGLTPALLARLRQLSDRRKTLADLDQRIQAAQQLSDVYKRWGAVADSRQHTVLHRLLLSLTAILVILLAVVLIDRAIRHAFLRRDDRRRTHQLRVLSTFALQFVGLVPILFIVFGRPSQLSTVIGLATAGLTVALRDFIVAFFGWFALMGKNGIRIGDWVEIEGVGGEVIEIGLIRTVLLEMGNWTNTGHPTGRRVSSRLSTSSLWRIITSTFRPPDSGCGTSCI